MAYIVERSNRFYVVVYDGLDPLTGKERRRWHPAGRSRTDAEAIATQLAHRTTRDNKAGNPQLTVSQFLTEWWMPKRRQHLQATTAHRYQWMIEHYISPAVGDILLRLLRTEHLERLYTDLLTKGGATGSGLASKTVYDVHVIMRSALRHAERSQLVTSNVALTAHAPKPRMQRTGPECWTAEQLVQFLHGTRHLRLHPALRVAATTGMRRGEIAGLRWGDWHPATHRLSIVRSRHVIGGRSTETPVKTRSSRRCIDLDTDTETILAKWRHRQKQGHPTDLTCSIFTNTRGEPLHAESLSQLFDRQVRRIRLPRIRFHDLRHTHATLLIAAGTPIKVVSERLGHANPGFTMATYQHVLLGMGAHAAQQFVTLLETASR